MIGSQWIRVDHQQKKIPTVQSREDNAQRTQAGESFEGCIGCLKSDVGVVIRYGCGTLFDRHR